MLVLGIETSCDETGIALYDNEHGLLADALYSQIDMHVDYGGVVPELASRDHVHRVLPLITETLEKAGKTKSDIDAIAYTSGPGLVGALMVGAAIAESLALALDVPTIGVHHMEGHLLAPMLDAEPPAYPFLGLLVSGGHTQLIAAKALGDYEILGESIDDAAGEAFDKAAKMMGLPYPGGPQISKLAEQARAENLKSDLRFPRPMTDRPGLDFSFSGLKTFTLNTVDRFKAEGGSERDSGLTDEAKKAISLAFEEAVVDTIRIKCRRAFEQSGIDTLVVAGGVSANKHLRKVLGDLSSSMKTKVLYPGPAFCTDNGAMIAYAGCQRLMAGQQSREHKISVTPRWPMDTLESVSESA